MNENKAKALIDNAINELVHSIKNGQSNALRNYLTSMGRFHQYSFMNIMLISMQSPEASRVAGFHSWKKLGRHIIKGEKGIKIVAPLIRKGEEIEKSNSDSEELVYGFRIVHVFDIKQTDGKELPEISKVKGDPQIYSDLLNRLINSLNIKIEYSKNITALGYSTGGKIVIKSGLTPAEDFSVKLHELAHELLHQKSDEKLSKKQRETEAESVAFVVCHSIGLDTNSASADYIQLYKGDKDTLLNSLERIKRVSERILDGLTNDNLKQTQYIILEHFTGTPTAITNTDGELIIFDSYEHAENFASDNLQSPQIIPYDLYK